MNRHIIMKIPDNVLHPTLYRKAFNKVSQVYGKQTSAYRSMSIVKTYKNMGSKYKASKPKTDTTRWLKEQWIQVLPYILKKKIKKCGSSDRRKHACRPLKRISINTPITVNDAVKLHGKKTVTQLAMKKRQGSTKVRVNWKKGT